MKKKLGFLLATTSILGVAMLANVDVASAHGYVSSPPSRGYQGELAKGSMGYEAALKKYGNVITQPQGLEAPKGFPVKGPADGKIASANGALGDFILDKQASDMWLKSDVNTGINTFTWTYTASHSTAKWSYYMTKTGWNPDAPLTRDELELIGTIENDGSTASERPSHTVDIPKDHMGYHIIIAAWDVADTGNAFYSTIDVNVKNTGLPALPTKPTQVKVENVTKANVSLVWDAQTTAKSYDIYRDGKKIKNVSSNKFEDKNVAPDTNYMYEIVAVGANGEVSDKSNAIKVKTLSESDEELTTAPTGLHSMGETESSVSLMWSKATHTSGIAKYDIYRDGKFVKETKELSYKDTGLESGTAYTYSVKATSNDGVTSELSNEFSISTKDKVEDPSTGDYRVFKLGSLTEPELYTQGEVVSYKGKIYTTLQTHSNYGDTSWNPDEAKSLFEFQSYLEGEIPTPAPDTTWESKQVYNAGETVIFEGLEYKAQWWTQSNSPEKSDVWKLVSNQSVKWNASKAYSAGDKVTFEGKSYQAQWWTQGNKPGTTSVWVLK